jgi:uncharacterized protein YneF (UPF0154 family)
MTELPKGCLARYDAVLGHADALLLQFMLGNRTHVLDTLREFPPISAVAIAALMLTRATPASEAALQTWLHEVA